MRRGEGISYSQTKLRRCIVLRRRPRESGGPVVTAPADTPLHHSECSGILGPRVRGDDNGESLRGDNNREALPIQASPNSCCALRWQIFSLSVSYKPIDCSTLMGSRV